MKKPSVEDVEALLQIFAASGYAELHFRADGFEILLSDSPRDPANAAPPMAVAGERASPSGPVAQDAGPAPSPPELDDPELLGLVALTAPSLGHFYRSPKPGAPPFVDLGQPVDVHDTVCVIEVMKLFTLLEAGHKGVVRRICVEDGALVEFGQPLMYLEALPSS